MDLEAFKATLNDTTPPDSLPGVLKAMWYDRKNDWHRAHEIVQDMGGKDASLVHAYLHRKEGDLGNAAYWYNRAGASLPHESLEHEWETIVRQFLV